MFVLLVLVCSSLVACAPIDCETDLLSLVSFSGGLYSYGKPYECVRDTSRHWCMLSVLSKNVSSLNQFFSYVAPMALCVPRSCNSSDLVSFVTSELPSLPPIVDSFCWPDDPRTKTAAWTVSGGIIVGLFLLLVLFEVVVSCSMQPATQEEASLLEVNVSPSKAQSRHSGLAAFDWRAATEELFAPTPPVKTHKRTEI
jgi:hypothetical protein